MPLEAGSANATVRIDIVSLTTFVNWAIQTRKIERSPLAGLEKPRVGRAFQKRPRARYGNRQVELLLAHVLLEDTRRMRGELKGLQAWIIPQRPVLHTLVHTGVRMNELVMMIWGDLCHIDGEGWAIRVRAETTLKGKRDRYIPMTVADASVLEAYRQIQTENLTVRVSDDKPMFRSPLCAALNARNDYRMFEKWRQAVGIPKRNARGEIYCLHSFRHVSGDELAKSNLRAAQLMLGHASSKTTEHYLHDDDVSFVRTATEASPALDVESAVRILAGVDAGLRSDGHEPTAESGDAASRGQEEWALWDSNPGPNDYESRALTD